PCVIFFFQAEDGIRDWSVTGVQTCALPICPTAPRGSCRRREGAAMLVDLVQTLTRDGVRLDGAYQAPTRPGSAGLAVDAFVFLRSGERRVGEEGRWWW